MEDNNTSTPMKNDDPSVTLTIRLIMQGKEVGSIIGKKGEIVNRFREESGAKINISDGSCPERIVTVSGTTSAIFSAFTLITKKFEEWCSQFNDLGRVGKTQIPIRLIVPASQCGSLIGKSGSKIKEIRQSTGCSIQVASEMLPNSTERAVTLSGSADQITQCIYQICLVMLESPPRGATIPYRPKPQGGPVILANGQAYTIQGNYAVPTQETCPVFPLALAAGGLHGISGLTDPLLKGAHLQGAVPTHHHLQQIPDVAKNPLASLAALGLAGMSPANAAGLNPTGKTNLENMKKSPDVSISEFSKSPHYISKKQEDFLKMQKEALKTGEFVVICDISENYSFVLQNAARSRYWPHDHCTIHPFSIYFKDDSNDVGNLSVIIIAESYTNFSAAFQIQKELLLVLRGRFNDIKRIIFFADGAASYYKNKKNLYQLCQWKEEEHFDAEWHFFGKSLDNEPTCDGIGRAFKRNAMRESLQRPFENQLKNAKELYEWAITKESTICYRFCSAKSFENVEDELSKFKGVKEIPGIKKFHSFIPINNREIKSQPYSTSEDFSIYKLKKNLTSLF